MKKKSTNKPRQLKQEEKDLFKTHSKNYSKKHIEEMKKFKYAMKKVGK